MKSLKFKVTFKDQPKKDYSVPVGQMKLGQIGVITHYRGDAGHLYVGSIVGWSHPGAHEDPTLHDIPGRIPQARYREHTLSGPGLGTRVRILTDGDQLVAGADGALAVVWAKRIPDDPTIQVAELLPGQAGIITSWTHGGGKHVGRIVVRSSNDPDRLQLVGEPDGWDPVPCGDKNKDCRVRPIGPGDILEAYDGEEKKEAEDQEVFLTPERVARLTGRALRKPSRG